MHTEDDLDEQEKRHNKHHDYEDFYSDFNELYDDIEEEKVEKEDNEIIDNYEFVDDEKEIKKEKKKKEKFKFDFDINKYINFFKKFLSNKFNVLVSVLSILILVFGIMFINNVINGEEDIIVSGDYVDGRYDFNNTSIVINSGKINKIMKLDEFVECMAHHHIDNNPKFDSLNKDQKKNVYKTYFIIMKSLVLSRGYNSNTKTVYVNESDFNCCNSVSCELSNETDALIFDSYLDSKHEIIIPIDFDTSNAFVSYTKKIDFKMNDDVINIIIDMTLDNKKYNTIIDGYFGNKYKIYNISDYGEAYKPNSNIKTSFYWPIGSDKATDSKNGIYGGTPVNSSIITFYDGTSNKGIEIEAKYGTRIIAISDGTVESVMRDNEHGWYVKIKHGNYTAVYGNLNPNVINFLKMNDNVKQGQLVGYLHDDKTVLSGNGKLYFELYEKGKLVDPLKFISEAVARPKGTKYLTYVSGSNNKQTICLSLLATGFSNEAVTGLLANIQAESNFKPTIYGDKGTSYGICQWHLGRFTNLKKYCGSKYNTIECQLDYLLHELRNGEKNSFKVLQSKNSAYQMVTKFCQVFERPAGGAKSCNRRADNYANSFYKYVKNKCK